VVHSRDTMRMGIIIGRDQLNRRFVANTPKGDVAMMGALEASEAIGKTGTVTHVEGKNTFVLA
jgi:acetyl-CoA C-acetyltransferase